MKTLDIAIPEDRPNDEGYEWFSVDPDIMYPAAIEHANALLQDGADVPMYVRQHVETLRAAGVPASAWENALNSASDLSPKRREERAAVLEAARLIFTALLREQAGGPIGLHITKAERWRL